MVVFGICSSINGYNQGIYNSQERFEQTLESIKSIKNKVENSFIVLCENSTLDEHHKKVLQEKVDMYITTESVGMLKSQSESRQMIKILEVIKDFDYDMFFKISGRYRLNDNFNVQNFMKNSVNFREFDFSGRKCFSTVLYSFNKDEEFFMKCCYEDFLNSKSSLDIETGLYSLIGEKAFKQIFLGVEGNIAPDGEFIEH